MKKLKESFVAAALFLGLTGVASADLSSGLALYFSFDQPPSNGFVSDESGNGHAGAVNGASPAAEGVGGTAAFHFDGVDDHILVGDLGYFPEGTISFWMRADVVENWRNPLSTDYAGWDDNIRFEESSSGAFTMGALGLGTVVPFPNGVYEETYTSSLQPDRWYHVVYAWDQAQDYGYLDGKLVFSTPHPDADTPVHPNIPYTAGYWRDQSRYFRNVAIGNGYSTEAERYWKGFIDEVRIYNRALSSAEAQALYQVNAPGIVYQNFEAGNGSVSYGLAINGANADVTASEKHSGLRSWRIHSFGQYGGAQVFSQKAMSGLSFQPDHHDRLTFWVLAQPSDASETERSVRVRFFDKGLYSDTGNPFSGFELLTTRETTSNQWTKLWVLFTQLPSDFDWAAVDKIQFVNKSPGTYYFDDVQIVSEDRAYQAFEPWRCTASAPGGCGWLWEPLPNTTPVETAQVQEGAQSWRVETAGVMKGTGIQSQEKHRCEPGIEGCPSDGQDFWHVDLNPSRLSTHRYDRLTFWLHALGENGMDANIGVQFFDWGAYHADPIPEALYNQQVVWTRKAAVSGEWTQLSVPFRALPADFDLTSVNKLQFQIYWPGTYLLDDIRAAKPVPAIDQAPLPAGVVTWEHIPEALQYVVQESAAGPAGPWSTIFTGAGNTFALGRLSKSWLRLRWEAGADEPDLMPYASQWSDAAHYKPQPVLIRKAALQQGLLEWRAIPQASLYEAQEAPAKSGPWSTLYQGPVPAAPLSAVSGRWYRVRAIRQDSNGNLTDATEWGPALLFDPNGFVKATGTMLREQNGLGEAITLRGVNLGSALLIEPWMFFGGNHPAVLKQGDDPADPTKIPDDWTIRDILTARFGEETAQALLRQYQETYLDESDFDRLLQAGLNAVRLPIHYRDIRDLDAAGNWVGSAFRFDHIDRLVDFCADRGLYVLLDLHGAPGNQSEFDHSGRVHFNRLFADAPEGQAYRLRTVELWTALAGHYRNNTAVVGFDLLNEPAGAPSPQVLRNFYDQLYQAIRSVDPNHAIVMEGLWEDEARWPGLKEWDWLPNPADVGWTNVAYQFHYYCWGCISNPDPDPGDPDIEAPPVGADEQTQRHSAFLDEKFAQAQILQPLYEVPILIGEFTGFGVRGSWEEYLKRFNQHGWSWTSWSYKVHDSPSEWGLYTHTLFDHETPDFREDALDVLERKLGQYGTANHHLPNISLIGLLSSYATQPANQPPLLNAIGSKAVMEGESLQFVVSASDPDGQTPLYAAASLPPGASFDSLSGQFSWTPGFDQAGSYSVTFSASDGLLSDQEVVAITVSEAPLALLSLADAPDPFSPNNDARLETTTISAGFNHTADWTLEIKNTSGALVRSFAGSGTGLSRVWDGKNGSGARVADGTYTYFVTAADSGSSSAWQSSTVAVDTTIPVVSGLSDSPDPFRPSSGEVTRIRFALSEPAYVTLEVYDKKNKLIRTLLSGAFLVSSSNSIVWDGNRDSGSRAPGGVYTYKLWAQDKAQNRASPYPVAGTVTVK